MDVYTKSVKEIFSFMKSAESIQDAYLRAIKVENLGYLLPASVCHKEDNELISNLALWRNQNVGGYPTQFVATAEGTGIWLEKGLLQVEDRILFLVVDNQGKVLGHMGFNSCFNNEMLFEVDNVVRAENHLPTKNFFSLAMNAMIEWARKTINVSGFFLRVMDENDRAISFYERNGFVKQEKIPLAKEQEGGVVTYHAVESSELADKFFLKMAYEPSVADVGKTMILTAGPSISAKEGVYAYDAAMNGWNSQWSKYLTKFEQEFAEYVGVKYALATSSCTGALQIALMSLDIGEGDEVIVPDQTWVATANAVRYVGATPIFADVELDSWNLDASSVEKLITPKTKAIMPVHMYGHPARMDKIQAIAKKYNLKIVEDAAPAIGAEWQGKRCGSFGDFAGFSFQGAKLLVTGEGGMLVTDNEELYKKATKIWDQGRNPSRTFWIDEKGVKFKMSNVQAAIGLAQLERADELIEMKRRIFDWYQEGLANVPYIHLNKEVEGARSIYWMTSLRLDKDAPISRDQLIQELKTKNVDTRPVFPSISQYPIWDKKQNEQPTAFLVGNTAMNLPSGVCLTKAEVMYVCSSIKQILELCK
ncbi:aminotransferase [Thiomicrospira sp. S5]|nr:aminotransferase [Thiomicrospira sp. S5]